MNHPSIVPVRAFQAGLLAISGLLAIPGQAQADHGHSNSHHGGYRGGQQHQHGGNSYRGFSSRPRSFATFSIGTGYSGRSYPRYATQRFSSFPYSNYYSGYSGLNSSVGYGGSNYFGNRGYDPYRYSGLGYSRGYTPQYSIQSYPRQTTLYHATSYNGNYRGYQGNSTHSSVQLALARQGYYGGHIDGAIGTQSRRAIKAYQRDRGHSQTGTINPKLLRSLGVR
jgi:hypothetical protein